MISLPMRQTIPAMNSTPENTPNARPMCARPYGLRIVNNVAATAMFIPVAEGLARRFRVPRGRYLMPVAFASMTGGMCTLIGTSTNVAVSTALPHYGLRPLGIFELSPVGIAIAVLGVGYLLWAAPRLLSTTDPDDHALDAYGVREFLYEVFVLPGAAVAGKTLGEADLGRRFGDASRIPHQVLAFSLLRPQAHGDA